LHERFQLRFAKNGPDGSACSNLAAGASAVTAALIEALSRWSLASDPPELRRRLIDLLWMLEHD
jgi:hypothetical protein